MQVKTEEDGLYNIAIVKQKQDGHPSLTAFRHIWPTQQMSLSVSNCLVVITQYIC